MLPSLSVSVSVLVSGSSYTLFPLPQASILTEGAGGVNGGAGLGEGEGVGEEDI